MKVVTDADVTPHGWLCEACDKPFIPGDIAHCVILAVYDEETFVVGDWRCEGCWNGDLPVKEDENRPCL